MGQDVRLFRLYFKLICATGVAGKKFLYEALFPFVAISPSGELSALAWCYTENRVSDPFLLGLRAFKSIVVGSETLFYA